MNTQKPPVATNILQTIKNIPKSFMARNKSGRIYILIMTTVFLLNLLVGNLFVSFIYVPFVWQAWTETEPSSRFEDYYDWSWRRSIGYFFTPIWATVVAAYFVLVIYNILDGDKTTHASVSFQQFWNTMSPLWPFWSVLFIILSLSSLHLYRKMKKLSKKLMANILEITILAQIDYPNIPWDSNLSVEANKELYQKAMEDTEALRRDLKDRWMKVDLPTSRKCLLIRLDVMPEEAHSERAQAFTEEDIAVYDAIKRFSRRGIAFLSD